MNKNIQDRFLRYLQGTLSGNEELELVNWISLSDKNFYSFKKYISENQYFQQHSEETNAAWERTKSKLWVQSNSSKLISKRIMLKSWIKVAALIVIAFVSGVLINTSNLWKSEDYGFNEIIVPRGEKSQLILSDGSKVYLNSDSYLKYPAVFNKTERKVIFSGEAFFEIEKDQSHPFIVKTNKFKVRVTGTSFNLSTYDDDTESSVTLHSGKVTVEKDGLECKIDPGEKYIFNNNTYKYKVAKVDIGESAVWKNGLIVIDDLDLDEITKILQREFNVTIKIVDKNLKNIRYTGKFKPHETLEEVLTLIKDASPIKFKIEFNKTKDYVIVK